MSVKPVVLIVAAIVSGLAVVGLGMAESSTKRPADDHASRVVMSMNKCLVETQPEPGNPDRLYRQCWNHAQLQH